MVGVNLRNLLGFFKKNHWYISEESEVKSDPKSCKDVTLPCRFPGCEDLSCEGFCEKDKHCYMKYAALDKKCCECDKCSGILITGKVTYFSNPPHLCMNNLGSNSVRVFNWFYLVRLVLKASGTFFKISFILKIAIR